MTAPNHHPRHQLHLDLEIKVKSTASQIQSKLQVDQLPATLVVLGSGFKGFETTLTDARSIELADLPHVATPTVQGHGASLVVGMAKGTPVVVMTGRLHMYEGLSAHDVVYPLRVLARLGVRRALFTNASGSLRTNLPPGKLVLVKDQLNITGTSCLIGPTGSFFGAQFLDMANAFDKEWADRIRLIDGDLESGVYAGVMGPAYETPAEALMLGTLGADVVGMSTVQEVLAARQLGLKVACLSFVTNMSGGLGTALTHDDVLSLVATHEARLRTTLIKAVGV
jgi:purine-nucleoside phosphorylase